MKNVEKPALAQLRSVVSSSGRPPDVQHRFRRRCGKRSESRAPAAGHHHDPVGAVARQHQRFERDQVDDAAGEVDDRQVAQVVALQVGQRLAPVAAELKDLRRRIHDRGDGIFRRDAAQKAAADIAVGDGADQLPLGVDDQADLGLVAVELLDDLAHRGLRRDQAVGQRVAIAHRWYGRRGLGPGRLERTRQRRGPPPMLGCKRHPSSPAWIRWVALTFRSVSGLRRPVLR